MKKLSQKIIKLLIRKKLNISFAESCTGGLLSSTITSISGSSKIFTIGLVTYSNQAKIKFLKVPKKIILKHGAVSYETCLSMAKNLNKISKTNIAKIIVVETAPVLPNSKVVTKALGISATIPANIIKDIPFPIPL